MREQTTETKREKSSEQSEQSGETSNPSARGEKRPAGVEPARLGRRKLLSVGASLGVGAALAACGRGSAEVGEGGGDELGSTSEELVFGSQDGTYRHIWSDGLPDHPFGPFPRFGCPNGASPQRNYFRVPLRPTWSASFRPIGMNLFGVARNGVPFDPAGPFWHEDMRSGWQVEVMSPRGRYFLGLDGANGHVQPGGAYHYHGPAEALILGSRRVPGWPIVLVGFAADGYPIYAQLPPHIFWAPPIRSSYQLKSGCRPGGSMGPGGRYDGTFVQDYVYVAGSGELDAANGRWGPTPEFPWGTYHYYLTQQWPFIPRMHRAVPDSTFAHPPVMTPPAGQLKDFSDVCK